MKNIIKNISLKTFLILFGAIVVSSCVYDEADQIDGKGTSIIRLAVSDNFAIAAFDAEIQTRTIVSINRDAVSQSDLAASTSVEFSLDEGVLNTYNDTLVAHGEDPFTLLPADAYSFVGITGSKFDFASGEFIKDIQIELDPSFLDLSLKYALPLVLLNPAGDYKVSAANGYAIIQIIVKNQWDGEYHSLGGFGHPSSPRPMDRDKTMATRGATRLATEMGDLGATMILEVQPDNSILVVDWVDSPGGATVGLLTDADYAARCYPETNEALHPWTYYDNAYHPETNSFRLKYGYIGGTGPRTITEEITLK